MKVLLVDDDADIRLVAGFVLRGGGHDVLEAADGASARAAFAAGAPDVVLMDVVLGDEDGVALASELLEAGGDARVVFLTGSTRPEERRRMDAVGGSGVLQKPFDPTRLLADLDSLLGRG